MLRATALVCVLAGPGLCGPSHAATRTAAKTARGPKAQRPAVEARLGANERAPTTAELAALGRDVDAVLVEIAGDPKATVPLRARALSALAFVPTPAARKFLGLVLEGKAGKGGDKAGDADAILRRRAALALGWAGGPDALDRLGALLDNADPETRIDGAVGLGLLRLPAAAELLRMRLQGEQNEHVRAHMARQLRTIEAALAEAAAAAAPPAK